MCTDKCIYHQNISIYRSINMFFLNRHTPFKKEKKRKDEKEKCSF